MGSAIWTQQLSWEMYHKPWHGLFLFGGERCGQVGTGAFAGIMLIIIKPNTPRLAGVLLGA